MNALLLVLALSTQNTPAIAPKAMVVSAEPLATEVGVNILQKGGNAFDAAVAVGFALAVTYPQAGNIGGGGFLVGMTQRGTPMALDFRETAPAAATKDMFLDEKGNLIPNKSTDSYRSVGVPGTVDGLIELHTKFGKLPLADDIAPAILLAKNGFEVSQDLHDSLVESADRLGKKPSAALLYYPGGTPLAVGTTLRQPALAETLQRIADNGCEGFYEGETARLIARDMERQGGLITQDDLKKYHSKWRQAFGARFLDYDILTMPPPSSGGVTLAQILGLVDAQALKAAGHNSAAYVQMLTEAERLAYADRSAHLGDPDFVEIPVGQLTSRSYLEQKRKLIPSNKAGNSHSLIHNPQSTIHNPAEREETTHYCIVDKSGNVASVTYTLNGSYGSGFIVPGAGFLLNNEMDDFTAKPGTPNQFGLVQGTPNSIQPGKRMLSSMSPCVIKKDGRFFEAVGSPGGSTIITTVLQNFLNAALFDMDIQKATDAARFHHQWLPDQIDYEEGALSSSVLSQLESMGYKLNKRPPIGLVNVIRRLPDGTLAGYSDKRGAGKAAGY